MKVDNLDLADVPSDLLKVLRMALFQANESLSPKVDWKELHKELRYQALGGLAGDILSKLNVEAQLMHTWKKEIIYQIQRSYLFLMAQESTIRLLEQATIPVVVIKGSSASMYYPQPEYRTIGDIDILIDVEKYEDAVALLLSNGYSLIHEREELERHAVLAKDGVVFELHRQLTWISDPEKADIIEAIVSKGIESAERHLQCGRFFYTLPPLENGLVLLHHISQHMEEGVGLRQIIDWMMYVNSVLDDELWQCSFMKIAKQTGLEMLAIVVTRMCQVYLGLTEEGRQWCLGADRRLCDALLVDVLDNGNFGKKREQNDSGIIKVSSRSYNPFSILAHMQRIGLKNWQRAQENTWCRPFAWAYQIGVYARQLLAKRMTITDIHRGLRKGRKRAELLEALGVFRLRDGVAVRTENDYTQKKY